MPPSRQGRGFSARNDGRVSWHLKWHTTASGECCLTEITTTLTGTITLPRLENARPAQEREIDGLMPALKVHELGRGLLDKQLKVEVPYDLVTHYGKRQCAWRER